MGTALNTHLAAAQVAKERGSTGLRLAGQGTEFCFFTALRKGRLEGYRIPRRPTFNTANNPSTASHDLQVKEFELSQWAADQDLPTAAVEDFIEVLGFPVLVLQVMDDDSSTIDSQTVGVMLSRMHAAPPPGFLLNGVQQNFGRLIAERLHHRYALARESVELPKLPAARGLEAMINDELNTRCVVHLDIRRQNFRVLSGAPQALFDWSNALLAPPEIEAARLAEYSLIEENGIDYEQFARGYAGHGAGLRNNSAAWAVLQLDAAIMLVGVFRSVAENKQLARLFTDRARELANSL